MAAPTEHQDTSVVDLGSLLDAREDAVVTLVAGETRLAAHRSVLSVSSPVFAAMFLHDTLEASTAEVAIPDVEGPVLLQLVAYTYTGRSYQLPGMDRLLLAAADKFGVDALKASCEQQVVAQLDVENAAAAAVLAVRHSCPTLIEAALNFMRVHSFQVMATQGWAEAVLNHPKDVVEFTRLLGLPETSASAAAAAPVGDVSAAPAAISPAPTATPLAAVPAAANAAAPQAAARHQAPPPDDAAVSRFRSLSDYEKGRRLLQAAEEGAVEEVRALIAAGADLGETDGYVSTALHHAASMGHVEVARHLLEAGAAVGARDWREQTPLHCAAQAGKAAVVRLLLAACGNRNAKNEEGWTPLHWAARNGCAEAAAALLEGGADTRARDYSGRTALDLARKWNKQQVVDLLQ